MQGSGNNRTLLIIGGVLLGLCLCGCLVVGAIFAITGGSLAALFGVVAQPAAVGTQFLTAVQQENYDTAYSLMNTDLQDFYGSADDFGAALQADGIVVDSYSTSSTNVNNDVLSLEGTLQLEDGGSSGFRLELTKDGNTWRVSDFTYD